MWQMTLRYRATVSWMEGGVLSQMAYMTQILIVYCMNLLCAHTASGKNFLTTMDCSWHQTFDIKYKTIPRIKHVQATKQTLKHQSPSIPSLTLLDYTIGHKIIYKQLKTLQTIMYCLSLTVRVRPGA